MQLPFPSDAAPLGTQPAENCLDLDGSRPVATKADAKLPVMVWIYGGGFVNGGGSPECMTAAGSPERAWWWSASTIAWAVSASSRIRS